jgi:hypothetical protein
MASDLPTVRTSLDGAEVTPPGTPRSEAPATPNTPSIGTPRSDDEIESARMPAFAFVFRFGRVITRLGFSEHSLLPYSVVPRRYGCFA